MPPLPPLPAPGERTWRDGGSATAGVTAGAAAAAAAAAAAVDPGAGLGKHVIVMQHGLQGSSFDFMHWRDLVQVRPLVAPYIALI